MATTFSTHSSSSNNVHHLHQHLIQPNSHLSFTNFPPLTLPTPPSSSSPHSSPQQTGHFCNDCGVMFESSTSLEVHLSYHKENLLSRWAQDSAPNSSASSASSTTSPSGLHSNNSSISSIIIMEKTHTPSPQASSEQQQQQQQQPQYFEFPYGNEPNSMERPGPNGFQPPPPVDHGHHYQNHQFWSSEGNSERNGGGDHPPPPPPPRSDQPAEILDLDSHKVHVYQHQQQQQERGFYRPYLQHLLPPPPPPTNGNGWPEYAYPPPGPPPPSQNPDHIPPYGIPPPLPPTTSASYEIRNEPIYSDHPPPPQGYPPQGPPQNPPPPPSFNNSSNNNNSGPRQFNIASITNTNGPDRGARSPAIAQRSPPISNGSNLVAAANIPKSSPATPSTPAAATPPTKTKGWKGGECKRPKTYNCSACNKWFTSSGHLKRHYGTTLHKNSIRQKGEGVDEPPPPPPTTKGLKRAPPPSSDSSNDINERSSPPSPQRIKLDDVKFVNNNNNGHGSSVDVKPLNGSGPQPSPNPNNNRPPSLPSSPPYTASAGFPPSPYTQQQQQQQPGQQFNGPPPGSFHSFPPHPHIHTVVVPFSTSNGGYIPDGMPPNPPSNGHYSVPSPIVPTTLYGVGGGGGGYAVGPGGDNSPLPPFSTVGFSHYDPNVYQLPSYPAVSSMGGGGGNPQQLQQQQQQQRMHQPYLPPSSSPLSSQSNGNDTLKHNSSNLDNSFDCERNHNRDSPEELRRGEVSMMTSGDWSEGLDRLGSDGGGSPVNRSESSESLSSMSSSDGPGQFDGQPQSPVRENADKNSSPSNANPAVLKCPDCEKTFGRACYLTQHTKSSHSGGKPFKCPTCGKRFPEAPALSDHVAKHGSDKPYKCALCPKQFNHKTDLRRHLCLHTGEKPFVCHVCGKGFIRKDHMTKHTETHRKKQQLQQQQQQQQQNV